MLLTLTGSMGEAIFHGMGEEVVECHDGGHDWVGQISREEFEDDDGSQRGAGRSWPVCRLASCTVRVCQAIVCR